MIHTLYFTAYVACMATSASVCRYLPSYINALQYVLYIQIAILIDFAILYIYKKLTTTETTVIHIPASPISELEQRQRDLLWRLTTHVQGSNHIDGVAPIHSEHAYDAISGEPLDHIAYVLDDSIYSPLNATTLQQLYHPRTGRGPLKNPFTNLDVRRVRKVRILTDVDKEAESIYERAMRP
jgi:hypothetical protein